MNIAVCVKYVPDATGDRHFEDDKTVDRVGVDGLLSELDEYAVEQALQIKEKAESPEDVDGDRGLRRPRAGGRRGPQGAADGCRPGRPRRRRRDRRLRLPSPPRWCWPRPRSRRSATPYDLVMCGMASTDGSMSVVPAMLAERLGLPQVTLASVVEAPGRPGPDQARRRHRDRGHRAARCRWCSRSPTSPARRATRRSRGSWRRRRSRWRPGRCPTSASTPATSGLSVAWTRGRGHHGAPAARGRRDRHGRGRLGRQGAGRLPRLQEVHLSTAATTGV